jgi:hypothetical protein
MKVGSPEGVASPGLPHIELLAWRIARRPSFMTPARAVHPCHRGHRRRADPGVQVVHFVQANLLQNAIRYNVPHGRVHIATGQSGLRVTNTGPRVHADQVGRLLQPFQRLGEQRAGRHDGVGLGLPIVAAIAAAHGAALTARPGPEGVWTSR